MSIKMNVVNRIKLAKSLFKYHSKWILRNIRGRAWFFLFSIGITKNKPYSACYLVTTPTAQFDGLIDISARNEEHAKSIAESYLKKMHGACFVEFYACSQDIFFYGLSNKRKEQFEPGSSAEALALNTDAK